MKHCFCKILIPLALVLALAASVVALAENTEAETTAPPDAAEQKLPEAEQSDEDAALRDALSAYNAAKKASRLAALEEELKGYVEAGKLTQDQADLILKYCSERQSMGVDGRMDRGDQLEGGSGQPEHGRSQGKGGRMNPGQGTGGSKTPHGAAGRQRTSGRGNAGRADGTAFVPEMSTQPDLSDTDTI